MLEYNNIPPEDVLCRHFESYTPFIIRAATKNILTGNIIKEIVTDDVLVEASVVNNPTEEYKGDIYSSEYYSCPFKSFVDAYITKSETSHVKINNRSIYLAQQSIYDSSKSSNNSLCELYPCVSKEPFALLIEVLQVNLWMNLNNKSCSALHLDEYHNFLVLHQGTKFVKLISPEYTMNVNPNPAHNMTPHHSKLSWNDLINSTNNKFKVIEVEIHSGDLLFIPEGYWHAVESIPYSIAINYWFKSPLHKFIHGAGTKLDLYLIRYFIQSAMKTQIATVTSNQDKVEEVDNVSKKRKSEEISSAKFNDEQEFSNFMENYYDYVCENNIDQMRKHEKLLASIDIAEQRQLFPNFALANKAKFHGILKSVSPLCAHILTEKWETCDDNSFFAAIFDGNDAIVESLMLKKDALNKSVCDDIVLKLVQGDG
jgi:hypothetical protein